MSIKWTVEKLQEEALKYEGRYEFSLGSYGAYQAATRLKILDRVCLHMKPSFRWTLELLSMEAFKHTNRRDFRKNSPNAYHAAQRMGLLQQVCSHMDVLIRYWSVEDLKKEALKYDRKSNFEKGSNSAYHIACMRDIIDDICSHMKNSATSSFSEINLFNIIKSFYPKTQKLRDRKVNLPNKPHIMGLDLDLYIPELRKGIEFDGHYWHSSEGLRRSRSHWPDDDIHNYHQLKDDWFSSKGIQILHIKEEEWNEDKESCVKRCLKFLGEK